MPASPTPTPALYVHQNHITQPLRSGSGSGSEIGSGALPTRGKSTSTAAFSFLVCPEPGTSSPSAAATAASTRLRQSCNCSLHHRNLGKRGPRIRVGLHSQSPSSGSRSNLTLSLGRTFPPARSVVIRLKLSKELPRPRTRRFIQTLFCSRPATATPAHICGAKTQTQTQTHTHTTASPFPLTSW